MISQLKPTKKIYLKTIQLWSAFLNPYLDIIKGEQLLYILFTDQCTATVASVRDGLWLVAWYTSAS